MFERPLGSWGLTAAIVIAVVAAVEWTDRPPRPRPPSAPPTAFSEARALPIVRHLTEMIGDRRIGSPGGEAAAGYLAELLRAIPGVDVEIQEATTAVPSPGRPNLIRWFRARNVLARIPGDSASAILVSAHYDSPPESVGAGDDAVAVAAIVETARALAAGPRPRHTVIFILNDGEEAGLLGAAAFVEHPWIERVRAFVNLESAGPRGKAILFQVGPGNAWLARAYARSVPYPYGSVVAQDIFQSGAIPSDTDFRIYRDLAGLRGLDIATYQDGYAYHTPLDRIERIEPGTLQHMGENTLALVTGLANGRLPDRDSDVPGVYYDLLGAVMLTYGATTARILALLALLIAAIAIGLTVRRKVLTPRRVIVGTAIAGLGILAGLALAIVAGLGVAYLLRRPHAWYAAPELGIAAFGAAALTGVLSVHALWERVSDRRGMPATDRATMVWAGAVILWSTLLAGLSWRGLGSAYIALWWSVPAAVGLAVAALQPRWARPALVLAFLPGAIVSAQVGSLLLKLFVPVAGRLPLPLPFDPVIAALAAAPVLALALLGMAIVAPARRLGHASATAAAIAAVALVALAFQFPYSASRPKRIILDHREVRDTAALTAYAMDYPDLRAVFAELPDSAPRLERRSDSRFVYETPAEPTGIPAPRVTILDASRDGGTGERVVRFHIRKGGFHALELEFPRDALAGWSLPAPVPDAEPDEETVVVRIYAMPDTGWTATVRLRGDAPVAVRVDARTAPALTPAIERVVDALPSWTTPATRASSTRWIEM